MMNPQNLNILTMVLAGGKGERLSPLTANRSKPAVPFGGSFRIVDFTLMNCVMSGIRRIHVLTQVHSQSLSSHFHERWGFLSKELGESIETVPPKLRSLSSVYRGTADAVLRNLDLIEARRPDIVLVLSGDHVYRADYSVMIRHHLESKAAATVLCGEIDAARASAYGVVLGAPSGVIEQFVEKPGDATPYADASGLCRINLGVYCFETRFLVQRLVEDGKRRSDHDFGKNILPESVRSGRVVACPFRDVAPGEPYWRDVGSIDNYFQSQQDLLEERPLFDLLDPRWPVDSRFNDLLPVRVAFKGSVERGWSLISPGAQIDRARVVRSVISPRVRVGKDATLDRCVLFSGVRIGAGARIRNAIIDEGVVIPDGEQIGHGNDTSRFEVSAKGIVVVEKGHEFPGSPSLDDGERVAERSFDSWSSRMHEESLIGVPRS